MAGHSKWANIKHRKAAQDARRGKIFTRLIRELVVAAKLGGPNPDDNPRLRTAVDKALGANMTRDTVARAIARGAGGSASDDVEELTYEGYAGGGVAVLVEAMTDNRNRTVAEVRHAFSKYGGQLGADGSVAYLFNRCGVLIFAAEADEDELFAAALEAGADDIENLADGSFEVLVPWREFHAVQQALHEAGFEPVAGEVTLLPATTVSVDAARVDTVLGLVDALEELEDVQNVYTNMDIPEGLLHS